MILNFVELSMHWTSIEQMPRIQMILNFIDAQPPDGILSKASHPAEAIMAKRVFLCIVTMLQCGLIWNLGIRISDLGRLPRISDPDFPLHLNSLLYFFDAVCHATRFSCMSHPPARPWGSPAHC